MKRCLNEMLATVALLAVWLLSGCAAPAAPKAHGADLMISGYTDQTALRMGQFTILVITVTNRGPESASEILFGASLPPTLKIAASSCSAGSPTDGSFCELDHLASGQEAVAKVVVTPSTDLIPVKSAVNVDIHAVIPEFLAFDPNRDNNSTSVHLQILKSP
jgi:uncharacterized repeat protein (TIGR01451 family)